MQVMLGKIVATLGLKGEVKVYSNTDFASKRYQKNKKVILVSPNSNTSKEFIIASYRNQKGMDIVSFVDYQDINLIEKFIGWDIMIENPQDDLPEDVFYYADIIGNKVYNGSELLGIVSEIINAGNQKILRVKRENKKDLLYPFVKRFISEIDTENKIIYVSPIEGMIE